ncbi:MAG: hypothetical protein QX199_12590 [Methylococcaceae bacterium]
MIPNDFTDAVSVAEETALSSAHAPRKTPEAAVTKPELQLLPGEDGGEWEGFYDDGDGWVEL